MYKWHGLQEEACTSASGVISRVTIVVSHIRGLITPLITTHEPPSTIIIRDTIRDAVVHKGYSN